MSKDLNDASTNPDFGTYTNGWSKNLTGDKAIDFTYYDYEKCHLKFSLEEIDSSSVTAKCEVVVPCTNTPFAYAPCWIKGVDSSGAYVNTGTGENRHGFYMLTF